MAFGVLTEMLLFSSVFLLLQKVFHIFLYYMSIHLGSVPRAEADTDEFCEFK
jgi:hypothetical protein